MRRQVIYVEVDEEISSIYDRVKRLTQKEIWLVVPRKAILFQSAVNLKILKAKLKDSDRKLLIVTSDPVGRHLAQQNGIPVLSKIEVRELHAPKDDRPEMSIEPIQARRNEILKDLPRRFTEKKITIGELVKEFREKNKNKIKGARMTFEAMEFGKPNRKFIGLILLFSLGLFMLISYIALPGATVSIRPKFENITHTVNITLADKRKNQNLLNQNKPNVIASERISTVTKQTKVFNTTSKRFDGVNATGVMRIINSTDEDWELKKDTRFQTEEGLIFRIQEGLTVPGATVDEAGKTINGEIQVPCAANPFDIYDDPIGERGNIEPAEFKIPGLSAYNQKLIWGVSDAPMAGGVTKYERVVMAEDIEAAKKQIQDNLILMARDDLRAYLEETNRLNNSNLVLMDDSRYLKTELVDLRISDDLEGSSRDKFEVFAEVKAEGVAYDFNQLYELLKKELKTRSHPDMQIRDDSINQDTITYEVIDEDEDSGQLKITASIEGIEEYVIEPTLEAGLRFSNKVKEKIAGLTAEEAESIVSNFPEVDIVQIKLWPFWLNRLPRIPDNIEIRLMESN